MTAVHLHHPGNDNSRSKRLLLTFALVCLYMLAEFVGGILSGSLALLADAGHMLSDAAALGLTLFTMWLAKRPADEQRSYGYQRAEILAALCNGVTLVTVALWLLVEAWHRVFAPAPVNGVMVFAVATGGLVVNALGLIILSPVRGQSLNFEGAWLHVLSDLLGSVGAITAGALIWLFGWVWIDPLISVFISLLIAFSAYRLLRSSVAVLMQAVPDSVSLPEVRAVLKADERVLDIHDLHVWTLASGHDVITAHIVVRDLSQTSALLSDLHQDLRQRFQLSHSTLQLEPQEFGETELHS